MIGRIGAELRHALDVPIRRPIKRLSQVKKPRDKAALRIEIKFVESACRPAAFTHFVIVSW